MRISPSGSSSTICHVIQISLFSIYILLCTICTICTIRLQLYPCYPNQSLFNLQSAQFAVLSNLLLVKALYWVSLNQHQHIGLVNSRDQIKIQMARMLHLSYQALDSVSCALDIICNAWQQCSSNAPDIHGDLLQLFLQMLVELCLSNIWFVNQLLIYNLFDAFAAFCCILMLCPCVYQTLSTPQTVLQIGMYN